MWALQRISFGSCLALFDQFFVIKHNYILHAIAKYHRSGSILSMAGTLTSEGRHSIEGRMSESDAPTLDAESVMRNLHGAKPLYSVSNFDHPFQILESSHTSPRLEHTIANEIAPQMSDEGICPVKASTMALHKHACLVVGSRVDSIPDDQTMYRTALVKSCLRDQVENRKISPNKLPFVFINSCMHSTAAGDSAICSCKFPSASRGTENIAPAGILCNSQSANDVHHPNNAKHQSPALCSQIKQASALMPQQLTFLNSNITSEVRIVDNPLPLIPDCCSPSRNSSCQVICMTDNNVSESGWTLYFDQSTDFSGRPRSMDLSYSDLEFVSRVSSSPQNKDAQHQRHYEYYKEATAGFEDSSMLSDASSGPEQPFLFHEGIPEHITSQASDAEASRYRKIDDLRDDACTSALCLESISDSLSSRGRRRTKRRKKDLVAIASPTLHIETTRQDEEDYVSDRVKMLQQLIPNSEKLEKEEVLAFAIYYVKALELQIQMFESTMGEPVDYSGMEGLEIFAEAPVSIMGGIKSHAVKKPALQEKGLCLMPISLLGKGL